MTPDDYFNAHQSVLTTLSGALESIQAVEEYATSREFQVFWRGQTDHRWGLTSSLVRQLTAIRVPDDSLLNNVEDRILKDARAWVTDLEADEYSQPLSCLAYLQHHGVPTRLIDFTRDPWMAMFFAVQEHDPVDGRLFAILVDKGEQLDSVPNGKPWRKYGTHEIKVWDPSACGIDFPRLTAQKGVFAFGRLPSTKPYRQGWDELLQQNRSLLAEEVRRILSIPFKLSSADPIPAKAKPPVGLTFRIHIDKESVRRDLSGTGKGRRICPNGVKISHQKVFPDVDGMTTHSPFLRGLSKGMVIP